MANDISLVLRAMRWHRMVIALIVVQIAMACAILGNGLNLVSQRYVLQRVSTGLTENRLVVLDMEVLQGRLDDTMRDEVLAKIDKIPGIDSTAYVNALPFSGRGSTFKFVHRGELERQMDGALYYGSRGFMKVLGVRIMSGRGFRADDFREGSQGPLAAADKIILSKSLARRLAALPGSRIEVAGRALTVIGIADDVMTPSLIDPGAAANTAFIPSLPVGAGSYRIVANTRQDATPQAVSAIVSEATRVTPRTLAWSAQMFGQIRADYFAIDRAVIRLILGMAAVLALVVAAGVGGLSSYWITCRHKQLAIRRALGARKADIARYLHVENLIITSMGGVLGIMGSLVMSEGLARWLTLPPIQVAPLLWGALAMIAIGQFAVLAAIRRAVTIPATGLKAA